MRLKNLDPQLKEIIFISSVIGEEITPQILGKIKSLKEGSILEFLDQAKRLKILKEEREGFSFFNEAIKDTVLKEISLPQRKEISRKISDIYLELYRDNLENIAFPLMNLFIQSGDTERLYKLYKTIGEKFSKIFAPTEMKRYLDNLIDNFKKEEESQILEFKPEDIRSLNEFLLLFQGALKEFALYPQGSKILEMGIENLYKSLVDLLKRYNALEISEIERSLVVNRRRFIPGMFGFLSIDRLVNFFIERDLKTISFYAGITKEELIYFLEILTQEPKKLISLDLNKIFTEKIIKHISVSRSTHLSYKLSKDSVLWKERFLDIVILDFIQGKISGKDLGFNLFSLFKENPAEISQRLLKAVDLAKQLDKYSDRINLILEGFEKMTNFIEEKLEGLNVGLWQDKELNLKAKEIFFGFDAETRLELIRAARPLDHFIVNTIRTLDEPTLNQLCEDFLSLNKSFWSLRDAFLKIENICKGKINIREVLIKKVKEKKLPEEAERFLKSEVAWIELPFQERIKEIYKMEVTDLKEIPSEDLQITIAELVSSSDIHLFKKVFFHLQKKIKESPNLKEKIQNIYIEVFKKPLDLKNLLLFLEIMFSAEEAIEKEDFLFILNLIYTIGERFKLFKFLDLNVVEKIKFLYRISKALEEKKTFFTQEERSFWEERFNLKGLVRKLLEAIFSRGVVFPKEREISDIQRYFFASFLKEASEEIKSKLDKTYDPFEKFLLFRKLEGIIFYLDQDTLRRFIDYGLSIFPSKEISEMLSYANRGILSRVLEETYLEVNDAQREKILLIIKELKLKETKGFLEKILRENPPLNLERIIEGLLREPMV